MLSICLSDINILVYLWAKVLELALQSGHSSLVVVENIFVRDVEGAAMFWVLCIYCNEKLDTRASDGKNL